MDEYNSGVDDDDNRDGASAGIMVRVGVHWAVVIKKVKSMTKAILQVRISNAMHKAVGNEKRSTNETDGIQEMMVIMGV